MTPLSRAGERRAFPLDPWPYTFDVDIVKCAIFYLFLNHYLFWPFRCPFFWIISKYKRECRSYFADVENCLEMADTLTSFFATLIPRSGQKCPSPCLRRGSWPMVCSVICCLWAIIAWLTVLGQVWWAAGTAGWPELSAMWSCEPVGTVDVDTSRFPRGLSAGPALSSHSHPASLKGMC